MTVTTLISFNVNGVRARPHQLEAVTEAYDPDVMGLQEIKVQDSEFPLESVESLGYHVEHFGQKGHYGVALLSKVAHSLYKKAGLGTTKTHRSVLFMVVTILTVKSGTF